MKVRNYIGYDVGTDLSRPRGPVSHVRTDVINRSLRRIQIISSKFIITPWKPHYAHK